MEKQLILSLIRICQSEVERLSASQAVQKFCEQYHVGARAGAKWLFTAKDKAEICEILLKTQGIVVDVICADSWAGLSRASSLQLGNNEKLSREAVRRDRVAVKSLGGQPLLLDTTTLMLPVGANLDLDGKWLAMHCQHRTALVVENWETFEHIHTVSFPLTDAGTNPLVIFRGSPVYRQDHVVALLQALAVPVYAFVDFDPAGLVIAQSLPHFAEIIAPEEAVLRALYRDGKNHKRFASQLPGAAAVLDASEHRNIQYHWDMMCQGGAAVPQEIFLVGM